jgi:uncharacterized spore protein YtfJ
MSSNVVDVLKGVVGELREMADSETIIGEPITAGDTTVIPVVKISVGFGAGGGEGSHKGDSGFGGGGGGGAKVEPAAFLIIDKDGVRILTPKKGTWEGVIEAIPALAKKVSKIKDSLTSAKKEMSEDDSPGDNDGDDSDQ